MGQARVVLKIFALIYFIQTIAAQRPYNDLRARFAVDPTQGFYEIPLTTNSSLISNYVQVQPDSNVGLPVTQYCYPDDPRVCWYYDMNGVVAGVQITYLEQDVADINPVPYNYSAVGGFVPTNLMNQPGYGFRAYFTNPSTLTSAGRQILNETVEGLWVYLNGDLVQVQRNEPSPDQTYISGFNRQNCFPRMGQHYFYRMSNDIPCNQLLPFYPLYQGGGLVGFGIADFGKGSDGPQRVWYERPPLAGVQAILENRPACLDTWVQMYGLYSLHVYFVDHPWEISCPA
ncbi:uncharacterized protein [Halyomorpha halys]|uniref:uncharacterized protein n=1 Tax=Halyomorpha halys TaxID=286706 RepID=UPI0006D5101C